VDIKINKWTFFLYICEVYIYINLTTTFNVPPPVHTLDVWLCGLHIYRPHKSLTTLLSCFCKDSSNNIVRCDNNIVGTAHNIVSGYTILYRNHVLTCFNMFWGYHTKKKRNLIVVYRNKDFLKSLGFLRLLPLL